MHLFDGLFVVLCVMLPPHFLFFSPNFAPRQPTTLCASDLMFDLDETVQSRQSMADAAGQGAHQQPSGASSSSSSADVTGRTMRSRTISNERERDNLAFGKALSLSLSLSVAEAAAAAGNKSPGGGSGSSSRRRSRMLSNTSECLKWDSGYCSKMGIRSTNEDRFACNPDITEQVRHSNGLTSGASASAGILAAVPATRAPPTGNSSNDLQVPPAVCNAKGVVGSSEAGALLGGGEHDAAGYFAVYDGHGGQQAAIYLEQHLLDNICNHSLFTLNLQQAVIDTCISTDRDFLVHFIFFIFRSAFLFV
jgi:hypothetical protein